MFHHAAQFAYGLLGILALVLVDALCFYALWYVVLLLVSYVPIVGHRHKHDRWDELNAVRPARRPTRQLKADS